MMARSDFNSPAATNITINSKSSNKSSKPNPEVATPKATLSKGKAVINTIINKDMREMSSKNTIPKVIELVE